VALAGDDSGTCGRAAGAGALGGVAFGAASAARAGAEFDGGVGEDALDGGDAGAADCPRTGSLAVRRAASTR
jgi:hypothetical protein